MNHEKLWNAPQLFLLGMNQIDMPGYDENSDDGQKRVSERKKCPS